MTRRTGHRRYERERESGQMIVIFALCLIAIIAMAGLLVDGGLAWANRRQAQAAADTAALAAAKDIVSNPLDPDGSLAAQILASSNGFNNGTDCSGNLLLNGGVTLNRPPATGPHAGDSNYVEVLTTRKMQTALSGAVGLGCFMVTARAVASIGVNSVAKCSFCAINRSDKNHTLLMQSGAKIRVDGDIYVNSTSGLTSSPSNNGKDFNGVTCTPKADSTGKFADHVCGDAFDLFGSAPSISAQTISVAGAWEEQGDNGSAITDADGLKSPCPLHTEPINQVNKTGIAANVCIGMPQIADPLNDPSKPKDMIAEPDVPARPAMGVNGCPASGISIPTGTAGTPVNMVISSSTTLCPGAYYGGIKITGGTTTLVAGIYYIAGGGFQVLNAAALDGSSGVMIFNASGSQAPQNDPGVDLIPPGTAGKIDPTSPTLQFAPGTPSTGQNVTVTFTFTALASPIPTGIISFADGDQVMTNSSGPSCGSVTITAKPGGGNKWQAKCITSWASPGTKSVTAVYSGDSAYNPTGLNQKIDVSVPAGAAVAPINIVTTGSVKLTGPKTGPYAGLAIFQARSSLLTVTINPGSGSAPACGGGFMTIGVPNGTAPAPCGALGGIQGTIYAAGQSGQSGALVYVTASGLANLQIIASNIEVDNANQARFAYTPGLFANGGIRLVE